MKCSICGNEIKSKAYLYCNECSDLHRQIYDKKVRSAWKDALFEVITQRGVDDSSMKILGVSDEQALFL